VLERAVILTRHPPLRLDLALPGAQASAPAPARVLTDADLKQIERDNIARALERARWRVSGPGGAAELLGINASTLRDRMRAFDLQKPTGG
jgi:transcriptional regulator with GAF, ATPase, and Fis domain